MWPKSSLFWQSLALRLAYTNAQAVSTVTYGPNGPCSPPPTTVTSVIVAPAIYSQFIQSASVISNIFGNGGAVTINNGPTTYITNTYITTTIISTITTTTVGSSGNGGNTVNPTLTGLSTSGTNGPVSTFPTSYGPRPTPSVTYPPVPPPQTSTGPPPVLTYTTTDANGNTITVTTQQPTLTIGEGLDSGTVSTIAPTDPVILGFNFDAGGAKVRRQAQPTPSDSLSNPPSSGFAQGSSGGAGNNCGFATRYALQNGQLVDQNNNAVGRNASAFYALITPWPYYNQITTQFTFVDGVLSWNSPDQGPATFYQCGLGPLYAGFPYPPRADCSVVNIGGIKASACPADYTVQDSAVSSSSIPSSAPSSSPSSAPSSSPVVVTSPSASSAAPSSSPAPVSSPSAAFSSPPLSSPAPASSVASSSPPAPSSPSVSSSPPPVSSSPAASSSSPSATSATTSRTTSTSVAPASTSSSAAPVSTSPSVAPASSSTSSSPPGKSAALEIARLQAHVLNQVQ